MDVVWFAVGLFIGCALTFIFNHHYTGIGTLQIDKHDPTNVKWRLCLNRDIDPSGKKRYVLTVDDNADLSQK